ncbi:MAG: hypothetical protein U9N81_14350 [Bacillota bacterium]|nr:hypothetical protein [Bacillota bacterium]
MEDSITLGADAVNLSLGGAAKFVRMNLPGYETVQRLIANGVVVVFAAGNFNRVGDGYKAPYAKNLDIGVVDADGNLPGTLDVASIGNSAMFKTIQCGENKIPYQNSTDKYDPIDVFNG